MRYISKIYCVSHEILVRFEIGERSYVYGTRKEREIKGSRDTKGVGKGSRLRTGVINGKDSVIRIAFGRTPLILTNSRNIAKLLSGESSPNNLSLHLYER